MGEILERNPNNEFLKANNQDLDLIEQRFIGSTEEINGEMFDFDRFAKDIKDNEVIPSEYKTPVCVLKGNKSAEEASIARKGKYLRGLLSFLGESGIELYEKGYETIMEVSASDPLSFIDDSNWRLFALDKNGQPIFDRSILEILKPSGRLSQFLDFDLRDDGIYITLKTNNIE